MKILNKSKMKLNMNKRSQSHVEMIISFLLFIGVVILLFIFLNPVSQPESKTLIMDNVKKILIQNMSLNIGKLSIITNETGVNECYDFNSGDYSENSPEDSPRKYIEIAEAPRKYTIIFSEGFSNNNAPKKMENCNSGSYILGSYSEEKIIVYEKVISIKKSYNSIYSSLKRLLGISNDFSFGFRDFNGNEISELSVSKNVSSTERKSEDIPVRVINSSGSIQELILNIKAW